MVGVFSQQVFSWCMIYQSRQDSVLTAWMCCAPTVEFLDMSRSTRRRFINWCCPLIWWTEETITPWSKNRNSNTTAVSESHTQYRYTSHPGIYWHTAYALRRWSGYISSCQLHHREKESSSGGGGTNSVC